MTTTGAPDKGMQRHPAELLTIARGAGITFAGKILGGGVQYLYAIVVARMLGPEQFGIFVLGLALTEFIGQVSRLGLEGGVVRYVADYLGRGDKPGIKGSIVGALRFSLLSSCGFALLMAVFSDRIAIGLFGKPDLAGPLRIFAVSLPFTTVMTVALNATQGFQRMDYTVYAQQLFAPLSNVILLAVVFILGPSLGKICAAYWLTAACTALLSLSFLVRAFPGIRQIAAVTRAGELFRFGLPFLSVTLLMILIMWLDTLIMGHFRPANEVGVYTAAVKTALFINAILLCFSHIFSPIISNLFGAGETRKLELLFKAVTRWIVMVSVPLFLALLFFSGDIMSFFGPGFRAGSLPLIILATAQLVNVCTGPVAHMLVMSGRQNLMFANSLAICVINAALSWILVPVHGGVGAAVASGCSIVLFNGVMLVEVKLLMGMHPYNGKIFLPFGLGMLAGLFAVGLRNLFPLDSSNVLRVLVHGGGMLLSYLGLYLWAGLRDEDEIIVQAIRNKWTSPGLVKG